MVSKKVSCGGIEGVEGELRSEGDRNNNENRVND